MILFIRRITLPAFVALFFIRWLVACTELLSKGLSLILFCMCGTLERADSMGPIQVRLRNLMVTVNDPDTRELLEDTIALIEMNRCRPRMVPEARLIQSL